MEIVSEVSSRAQNLSNMKWLGTVTGVGGAILVALNFDFSGYGFLLFLISTLMWGGAAFIEKDKALMVLQANLMVVNIIGVYRWLIL